MSDFTRDLNGKLPSLQDASPDLDLADISHHISTIKNLTSNVPLNFSSKTVKSLEKQGRELWNLCIRLKRDPGRRSHIDCRVRLLALHILDLSHMVQKSNFEDEEARKLYILGLSMTMARICLRDEDLESGRMALQKAAELVEQLKALRSQNQDNSLSSKVFALEADYLTMRMALVSSLLEP